MSFPYTISNKSFTVFIDGKSYQTDRSNPNWQRIKDELNKPEQDGEMLKWLVQPINAIKAASADVPEIEIRDGSVFYGGEPINSVLANRMLDIMNEGLALEPWVKFAQNLYSNPEAFAREELYEFLEKSDLPLTQDGCFIAYKIVGHDYLDLYTHTMDNSVGNLLTMERTEVDPNRNNTCSRGLHFCSKGYLPHYGVGGNSNSRVMLVKINPADVVSIPSDYDNAKGRTWRYEVVGEIDREDAGLRTWEPVAPAYGEYTWGYTSEDDDAEFSEDDLLLFEVRVVTDEEMTEVLDNVFGALVQTALDEADDAEFNATLPTDDPEFEAILREEAEIENQTGRYAPVEPVIESVAHGVINKERFLTLREQYGTLGGMARGLGISAGTVQAWKTKLFGPAK